MNETGTKEGSMKTTEWVELPCGHMALRPVGAPRPSGRPEDWCKQCEAAERAEYESDRIREEGA